MTKHQSPRPASYVRWLCACASVVALFCANAAGQVAPGSPVLLTEGTGATTRGVAYEAVTHASEPFTVASPFNWNADKANTSDQRTRLMLFAMNLGLLAGEGANALSADAVDASGRVYQLKVESLSRPVYVQLGPAPGNPALQIPLETPQHWLHAVVVRLSDDMADDLGDVLVSINLHGLRSNRVRVRIGQNTGGPAVDPLTEYPAPAPATPPPPTPTPTPKLYGPGEAASADVVRLLDQATWGATSAEVARVQGMGIRAFVEEQLNAPFVFPDVSANYPTLTFPFDAIIQCPVGAPNGQACRRDHFSMYPLQVRFFLNAMEKDADAAVRARQRQNHLRGRVAFALHQILVVSGGPGSISVAAWMTPYLQALDRGAFGNYRALLREITLNPAMGEYLDMRRNLDTSPNENYAREILQLFSIGVDELNLDGTPKLDAQGRRIPTYTQTTVNEFTRILTGWDHREFIASSVQNYRDPMAPRTGRGRHDAGAKTLLNGVTVPACPTSMTNQQCAESDLEAALDNIFNHPNVGPFVGKQLIQHLVTSNPSPAYVERVARVFNDDCAGLYPESPCGNARGNMKAVVRAVVLDPEARGDLKTDPNYGRHREPAQYITNMLRAFDADSDGVLGAFSVVGDLPGSLDQPIFQPPTVFSYYSPDYEVAGTKLLGPQFQLLSTLTSLRRANVANRLVYLEIPPATNHPLGTHTNWAALEAIAAADPTGQQLVNHLDALLTHGTLPASARASVLAAVQAIGANTADAPNRRARQAAYLIITSPHFDVQR